MRSKLSLGLCLAAAVVGFGVSKRALGTILVDGSQFDSGYLPSLGLLPNDPLSTPQWSYSASLTATNEGASLNNGQLTYNTGIAAHNLDYAISGTATAFAPVSNGTVYLQFAMKMNNTPTGTSTTNSIGTSVIIEDGAHQSVIYLDQLDPTHIGIFNGSPATGTLVKAVNIYQEHDYRFSFNVATHTASVWVDNFSTAATTFSYATANTAKEVAFGDVGGAVYGNSTYSYLAWNNNGAPTTTFPVISLTSGANPVNAATQTFLTNTGTATGNAAGQGQFSSGSSVISPGSSGPAGFGYVSGINSSAAGGNAGDSKDYVKVSGLQKIVLLKLAQNGTALDPTSGTDAATLNTIISDINTANDATFGLNPSSGLQLASTVDSTLDSESPGFNVELTLPAAYANFLTANTFASGQYNFGFDFSNYTSLGTITVTDMALVPEPTSAGLLSLVVIGTLRRRRVK